MDKRLSHLLTPTQTLLGFAYWSVQLFVLPRLLNALPLTLAWQNVVFYCLNFLFMTLICRRLMKHAVRDAAKNVMRLTYAVIFGFCGYYTSSHFWGNVLSLFFPAFGNVNDAVVVAMLKEAGYVLAFCTVVLVPISEELLFRGVIFGSLYGKSRVLAYAVSTAVFCAVHVLGYTGAVPFRVLLASFLQYIPAGLCLAWAYAKADNILAPIFIHSIVNAMGIASTR